jgi:hypothetical protein
VTATQTPPRKHAGGRPPKLDAPLTTRPDGTVVTIADRILASVAAGNYIETAAASAGIHKTSVYEWARVGARVNAALMAGQRRSEFTKHERRCAEFSDALLRAEAEAEAADVTVAAQLAQGGLKQRTVKTVKRTKKDTAGQVLESHETAETTETSTLPDGAMIRWRLAKRHPERWGGTDRVEISGPGGGPIELTVQEKRSRLLADLDVLSTRLATPDPELAALEAGVDPATLPPQEPEP